MKTLTPMTEPAVVEIGKKYNKTPSQILIRFLLQCDVIVIPKSVNSERIKENFNVSFYLFNTKEYLQFSTVFMIPIYYKKIVILIAK